MERTNNYDLFKFTPFNRSEIKESNVNKLVFSIQTINLLHLNPIIVDRNFTIINGQHRLLAAKKLGVDIYYIKDERLTEDDILPMNSARAWVFNDYLNFFCKKGNPHYIKFKDFMEKNNLTGSNALIMLGYGKGGRTIKNVKEGKFEFNHNYAESNIESFNKIINYISKMNGTGSFLSSTRFCKPLYRLCSHPDFQIDKMLDNLSKMIERVKPRVSMGDYEKMFEDIYNWRNPVKIKLGFASDEEVEA